MCLRVCVHIWNFGPNEVTAANIRFLVATRAKPSKSQSKEYGFIKNNVHPRSKSKTDSSSSSLSSLSLSPSSKEMNRNQRRRHGEHKESHTGNLQFWSTLKGHVTPRWQLPGTSSAARNATRSLRACRPLRVQGLQGLIPVPPESSSSSPQQHKDWFFFFFTTSPTSLLPRCFAAASESQWWAVTYTRPKENTKRKDKHSPLRQAEGHTHLHPLPQPLPLQHRTLSDDQVVVAHILLLRCQTWGETLMVSYSMRKHTANS